MAGKKLVIYGIGSFAEYVEYLFNHDSPYEVVGFCVENSILKTYHKEFTDKPLVSFEEIPEIFPPDSYALFIAVGNNVVRKRLFYEAKKLGYSFAKFISSRASSWDNLIIGENTFIDEGCKIHPFVEIGNNSLILFSTIGHHTKIGEHNLLSVSTIGGSVAIGNECFLGMNSVIKQNLSIADKNIIAMGCIIENSTEENSVYSSKGTIKRNIPYDKVSNRFLK